MPVLTVAAARRLGCLLLCALPVGAAAQPGPGGPWSAWINPGVLSYHFERDRDLRETNWGLGAEIQFGERHGVMAGSFINSERQRSRYLAYQWRPLQSNRGGVRASLGVAAGLFDGYPRYRGGSAFPAALPFVAVEGNRFGVNVFVVPALQRRVDGAIAIQFKLRVW